MSTKPEEMQSVEMKSEEDAVSGGEARGDAA